MSCTYIEDRILESFTRTRWCYARTSTPTQILQVAQINLTKVGKFVQQDSIEEISVRNVFIMLVSLHIQYGALTKWQILLEYIQKDASLIFVHSKLSTINISKINVMLRKAFHKDKLQIMYNKEPPEIVKASNTFATTKAQMEQMCYSPIGCSLSLSLSHYEWDAIHQLVMR